MAFWNVDSATVNFVDLAIGKALDRCMAFLWWRGARDNRPWGGDDGHLTLKGQRLTPVDKAMEVLR